MKKEHKFPKCSTWRNGKCNCEVVHSSCTVAKIKRLKEDLAREKKVMTRWWADHTILIDNANKGIDKLEKDNAALVANMDEMIHDLYGSNEVVANYWDEKTLHLRKKEGGEG